MSPNIKPRGERPSLISAHPSIPLGCPGRPTPGPTTHSISSVTGADRRVTQHFNAPPPIHTHTIQCLLSPQASRCSTALQPGGKPDSQRAVFSKRKKGNGQSCHRMEAGGHMQARSELEAPCSWRHKVGDWGPGNWPICFLERKTLYPPSLPREGCSALPLTPLPGYSKEKNPGPLMTQV